MKHLNYISSKPHLLLFIVLVLFCLSLAAQQVPVNKSSHKDIFMWYPNPEKINTRDLDIACTYSSDPKWLKLSLKNVCKDSLLIIKINTDIPSIWRIYAIDFKGDTTYYRCFEYSNSWRPSLVAPQQQIELDWMKWVSDLDLSKVYKFHIKHLVCYGVLRKKNCQIPDDDVIRYYVKEENIIVNKK